MTSKKLTPHKRRLKVIEKLVEVPEKGKRFFWAREMKILKRLEERYSLEFLEVVKYEVKDSLAYLASEPLRQTMDSKWNAFNYRTDESKYEKHILGEKSGKDYIPTDNKPRKLRDIFNE